jgi:hypothetical protein
MEIYLQVMLTHVVLAVTLGLLYLHDVIPTRILSEKAACWFTGSVLAYIPLVSLILVWSN